ncbi:MAG: NAD(P)H-hydrate dehydratase [Candidatus Ancillula sp.]|jgi:NAD(P)H-hydrate epimerase|nr:NAD(P)H-hydrate dehydratase [Candidatus Ancillula sp.]
MFKDICSQLFIRDPDSQKYDYGNILIIAGSKGMAGAAVMSAKACLRSGAGLVTVSTPDECCNTLQTLAPEAMVIGRGFDELDKKIDKYTAIALGPGLGFNESSIDLVEHILLNTHQPLIIDADGLNCLSILAQDNQDPIYQDFIIKRKSPLILTPHTGEAKRLLSPWYTKSQFEELSRNKIIKEIETKYNAIVILKGHETLVSNSEVSDITEDYYVNKTGNPGMAVGGSGDVLTGICLGIIGQAIKKEISIEKATQLAVYLHGLAGDLAKEDYGETSLLVTDIITYLPQAIQKVIQI